MSRNEHHFPDAGEKVLGLKTSSEEKTMEKQTTLSSLDAPTCSRLLQAALSLFERENRKDEAAMWDYIVAGKDLPEEPAGDRVRIWAWNRWGVDLGENFGSVPPISENA